MRKIKLDSDELAELASRALIYHSGAKQFLSMQTQESAYRAFKEYHDMLGEKYGYDPHKAFFTPDGEVMID